MRIGFVGLGKMGSNMCRNLLGRGHQVVVYDVNPSAVESLAVEGAIASPSLKSLGSLLTPYRIVWLMLPAGPVVDDVIDAVVQGLGEGDIIIDGGNSYYKDSISRAQSLVNRAGVCLLDVGVNGGIDGARHGLSMTVGGTRTVVEQLTELFEALAMPNGYAYVGASGAGHFAKMVHDAIECAVLEAYAEGIELIKKAPLGVDIPATVQSWNNGGVISSWLLELAEKLLRDNPMLDGYAEEVGGGETGGWAVKASIEREVPIPAVYAALAARYTSRDKESFHRRLISALRHEFGGHAGHEE